MGASPSGVICFCIKTLSFVSFLVKKLVGKEKFTAQKNR